jgi:hypothetical protein
MRILAASFLTEDAATLAQKALDRRFGTGDAVRIAPLGQASGPYGPTTVLAGRFTDDVIAAVRSSLAQLGGTVVFDADERETGNS